MVVVCSGLIIAEVESVVSKGIAVVFKVVEVVLIG